MADLETNVSPNMENLENNLWSDSPAENMSVFPWDQQPEVVQSPESLLSSPEITAQVDNAENSMEYSNPLLNEPAPVLDNGNVSPEGNQSVDNTANVDMTTTQVSVNTNVFWWVVENTVPSFSVLGAVTWNDSATSESSDNASENKEKNQVAQKQKLAQLIKLREWKAKKTWFTRWILSGIVLSIWIIALATVFAKDQIINLLWDGSSAPRMEANIVNLQDPLNENIVDEDIIDEDIVDEDIIDEDIIDEDIIDEDIVDEDIVDEDIVDEDIIDEDIVDEDIIDEDIVDEDIIDENIVDEDIVDENIVDENIVDENIVDENIVPVLIENGYTAIHVNSVEEANWVIAPSCDSIFCENRNNDNSFTECTNFSLNPKLDDNAHRIGSNWSCRYKDISELVYVSLES